MALSFFVDLVNLDEPLEMEPILSIRFYQKLLDSVAIEIGRSVMAIAGPLGGRIHGDLVLLPVTFDVGKDSRHRLCPGPINRLALDDAGGLALVLPLDNALALAILILGLAAPAHLIGLLLLGLCIFAFV